MFFFGHLDEYPTNAHGKNTRTYWFIGRKKNLKSWAVHTKLDSQVSWKWSRLVIPTYYYAQVWFSGEILHPPLQLVPDTSTVLKKIYIDQDDRKRGLTSTYKKTPQHSESGVLTIRPNTLHPPTKISTVPPRHVLKPPQGLIKVGLETFLDCKIFPRI